MCDALVWAASEHQYPNLPRFTGRIYAADDGIDAEWDVEIPLDDKALPTPIVGAGWNVFQYKKRDLIAQDRRRIVANLKSSLKRAVAALAKKKAKHPSRYILFVNVDLKGDQVEALKKSLLEGYDRSSEVHLEIIGAGGLAALLNDNPHLRAAYFTPLAFKTWEEANRSHRTQKLLGFDVALVGREETLNRLRAFVDDPRVRAAVVTGPHDIGKSRLVLEATSHCPHDVVFALDPRSMTLDDYRNLVAERKNVVCIVEDPDPDRVVPFVNEMLGIEGLKVVITLPSSGEGPGASYGQDERVQFLALGPLSDEDSRKLLEGTGKHLDFGVQSWILDQAGGNPGILLAAASVGEKLRVEAGDFAQAVGEEFERRIKSELGQDALKCAELLSILTHVGVSGKFEAELRVICDLFGEGWQSPTVLAALEVLQHAGLAKRGGSFAEITLPILAYYLAGKLLRGRKDEVFALFGRLDDSARLRFLRQLSQVRAEEVERFWDALFDPRQPDTPFGSLKSALKHAHMLRLIAGTVPERTLQLLESGLTGMSLQERLAIKNEQRGELRWAVEQLLFRSKTSAGALRALGRLAEAETESYANNATGVFCESFHPLHPQLPLLLDERLRVLDEILSPKYSLELRLIGVKAIQSALSRMGAITLRYSSGPEPLDSRPSVTYGEVWDYVESLVDLLMKAAQSDESALAISAGGALPHVIAECAIQARPESAVAYFKVITEWVLRGRALIRIADLTEALKFARRVLDERAQKAAKEAGVTHKKGVQELDALLASLDRGDFTSRLKRWAGKWTHDDRDYELEEGGRRLYRGEKELRALAREAENDPTTLADDLLTWLCTREAQKAHMFFWWLGSLDSDRKWLSKIEQLASSENGVIAFSAYFGGLSKQDSLRVSKRLDELALAKQVTAEAIAGATRYLAADLAGIRRMEILLQEKRVDPVYVERTLLCGGWIDQLSSDEYVRILRAIAGPKLENGAAVIDSLGMWMHGEKTIDGELAEFAWQCLEAVLPIDGTDAYDCDRLASKLAEADPERGFRLLKRLLSQPYERRAWNPIDRYGAGERQFWKALHNVDRERALRTVLSLALTDPLKHFQITWDFQDLVDQQGDADLLVKLALENDEQAEVIAQSITTARPGFWPIAFEIVKNYRSNRKIREALTGGIEQRGEVYSGPYSQHLESCRKEVERVLNDLATPPAARTWLQDVLSRFKAEIAQHVIWEYDEDVNSLRRYIEDRDSPERIWAIGRVLKYADLKDIRRLLTVEDISEALPQVDLPEKKRRALERALEVWQSGS
ncbi:MAG: ATP-binding protein [Deltaproteobacteria bacterium]|nr:ATP-binding protein [Deltaproteobacteria bacterium]